MNPTQRYKSRIEAASIELEAIRRRYIYIYIARIALFVALIASIFLCFGEQRGVLYPTLLLLSGVLFGVVIKLDLRYAARERYLKRKIEVNKMEIETMEGNFSMRRSGEEYRSLSPHLLSDFDLVGTGSLFQYLNRSVTRLGEALFIGNIIREELDPKRIAKRQSAIKELSSRCDFMQDFQIYGEVSNESNAEMSYLGRWLNERCCTPWLVTLSYVAPSIIVLWVALYIGGVVSLESIALPLVLNWVLTFLANRIIEREHSKLNSISKIVGKYAKLLSVIEAESFDSELLYKVRSDLGGGTTRASSAIGALSKILDMFDSRYNLFVVLVLNPTIGYNLQLYRMLASWREHHCSRAERWFEAISQIDSLIGLATFAHNNPTTTSYAEVVCDRFAIEAEEMGHPLIPESRRVNNSISISKAPTIVVITGANMAGKSTLLRTIAVNMILAMNGAPVAARSLRFTPCNIMSSIKIQDSLHHNESYFYAEISRLKQISQAAAQGTKTLVILDEILRGTNTRDKQQGSLGLLRRLISDNVILFVATHDLVIGDLEGEYPDIARNHCFEVELCDDELIFDYKLKSGVSQRLNASYLLRKMELID